MMPAHDYHDTSTAQYEQPWSSSERQHKHGHNVLKARWLSICFLVVGLSLTSAMSYAAGQRSATQNLNRILNLNSHAHVFQYNRSFTERPNATTNAAWKELFPVQGGFFKHPEFASKRSTFAVFHQLHCLDGLRHGYWALFDIASQGTGMAGKVLPFHASPRHVRHCIDLLRNVLLCQPDLTLEVKDDELGGVTGFGTEHQCVDWKELVDWTSHWETYQQTAGARKGQHNEGHEQNSHE